MKQRNNRGTRTVPYGTPDVTAVKLLCWPSTTTCCTLLETKLFKSGACRPQAGAPLVS